jgi:hypothetical protein
MASFLESSWIAFRRAHGELFGELLESYLESSWRAFWRACPYLKFFRKKHRWKNLRCHKDMEVSLRHRGEERTCWKDTKKYIGKNGELLESSWGVFLESS